MENTGTIIYTLGRNLYVNVTNRCTNDCVFCIRKTEQGVGYDLWLKREPQPEEIVSALMAAEPQRYAEIVFCGYGEPLLRLEVVSEVGRWLRRQGLRVRINTNGQVILVAGAKAVEKLRGAADAVSVSLNAPTVSEYVRLCRPLFGGRAFAAVLNFIREAKTVIPLVTATVVDWPGLDIAACRRLAAKLGVPLRVRAFSG